MPNARAELASIFALALTLSACGRDEGEKLVAAAENVIEQVVTLPTPEQHRRGDVQENSFIVNFRAPHGSSKLAFTSYKAEYGYHFSYLQGQLTDPRVKKLRFITGVNLANPRDPSHRAELAAPKALQLAWTSAQFDEVPGAMTVVDFADGDAAAATLAEWEAAGSIWYAEPNYINRLMDNTGNPYTAALAQSYTTANQWWHTLVKLPTALNLLASSTLTNVTKPVVAVLDSGVDIQNAALANNIWVNPRPGASGCPNDVNGCDTTVADKGILGSGDVFPYTTTGFGQACPGDGSADPAAMAEDGVCGHGTHVSGIIAAQVGTDYGGVCPVCQIMPIKIITNIGGSGSATDAAILTGFKYLTLFKNTTSNQAIVRVANSSFGKYVRDRSVALLTTVLKQPPNEVLVVGAAGNEDSMLRSYPAALTDAVAVAAVGPGGAKATYSNFGPWVAIAAPGGDSDAVGDGGSESSEIMSTVPGVSGTGLKQGTSMACPVVAGIAGLVLSFEPTRGWQDLRNSLINTADSTALYDATVNNGINYNYYYPLLTGDSERRPLLGSGVIDANAALANTTGTGFLGPQAQRVGPGCGAVFVGARRGPVAALWWLLLPALGPLWLASRPRGRWLRGSSGRARENGQA